MEGVFCLRKIKSYQDSQAKGKFFGGMGFTRGNKGELVAAIQDAYVNGEPLENEETPYGIKQRRRVRLKGPSGKERNIIFVYQIDKDGDGTPRFITASPDRKSRQSAL